MEQGKKPGQIKATEFAFMLEQLYNKSKNADGTMNDEEGYIFSNQCH